MPLKLKSKTGCLTCITRKKKCDEARNPKCGSCERLGLACIWRSEQHDQAEGSGTSTISTTNLKARPSPQFAISSGYPSFRSQFEKQLSVESSRILQPLICPTAGTGFEEIALLGSFCTQSQLVRDAIVAFAAHGQSDRSDDSYKTCLTSYQSCVGALQKNRVYQEGSAAEKDCALTAICFLGLLESLKLGDPSNSIAHFEMCRRLLVSRLSQPAVFKNPSLVKLYRVVAETILYTIATLSPYQGDISAQAVGDSFECLFPGDDYTDTSPFLGGFHEIYHVMFDVNKLLRRSRYLEEALVARQCGELWERLDLMEMKIERLYKSSTKTEAAIKLYRAKHRIAVLALRIHLIKISRPSATPTDSDVQRCLGKAIGVLTRQDVREPGNPALRWPMIVLACATHTDEDFRSISSWLCEIAAILHPADSRKLTSACNTIRRYREQTSEHRSDPSRAFANMDSQLDFLLEPRSFDESAYIEPLQSPIPRRSESLVIRQPCNRVEEL